MQKTLLYLGLDLPAIEKNVRVIHCPIIEIVARSPSSPEIIHAFSQLKDYTHLLFTSKNSVDIFFRNLTAFNCDRSDLSMKKFIAIGKATAGKIKEQKMHLYAISREETAEGMIRCIQEKCAEEASPFFFLPHSARSRPLLKQFLQQTGYRHCCCELYDTHPRYPDPLPNLSEVDEILFTSPSTVDAFIEIFGKLPIDKQLRAIGPITEAHLQNQIQTQSLR
jgi:uroporphyrinogen-III synthase